MSGNWASIPLSSLSDEQTSFIKTVLTHKDRSHFLSGCAGSGKSVIAAHVLQILKENNPDFSCSMIVFTKLLSKFISDGFKEVDDSMMQDVGHFHQRLTKGYQQKHTDMSIIDEFQDFRSSWIRNVKSTSNSQIWLGDPTQQIYQDAKNDNGVSTLYSEFENSHTKLTTNYRNSISVAQLAKHFMVTHEFEKMELEKKVNDFLFPIFKNPQQTADSKNLPNIFIKASNEEEEFDMIANIIKEKINSDEPRTHIAVAQLHNKDVDKVNKKLIDRGVDTFRVITRKGSEQLPDFNQRKLVMLSTIHSLKGLEVDYVIFPRTEEDKIDFWTDYDPDILENLLYVLFTRARARIYCSYVDENESLIYNKVFGKYQNSGLINDEEDMKSYFNFLDINDFSSSVKTSYNISDYGGGNNGSSNEQFKTFEDISLQDVRRNVSRSKSIEEQINNYFKNFDDEDID